MKQVIEEIDYKPSNWEDGKYHTPQVLDEFKQLFPFSYQFFLFEILGTIVTPFILLFKVFPHVGALDDFFVQNTVQTEDGDVYKESDFSNVFKSEKMIKSVRNFENMQKKSIIITRTNMVESDISLGETRGDVFLKGSMGFDKSIN